MVVTPPVTVFDYLVRFSKVDEPTNHGEETTHDRSPVIVHYVKKLKTQVRYTGRCTEMGSGGLGTKKGGFED